jgi:tetratricopeptide (TPR) repeat protein
LSFRERLTLFRQICDAIHYAHQRGVMHRDLKPSNILIDAHGTPRILDFGLARITDTELGIDVSRTAHGRIQGTLAYMSPEQARGDSAAIDIRSDVYSLGVILYELLTDRLPYDVMDLPLPRAVETICNQPPQPSASLKGDLETITLRALEKEPQRRYASAAALGDDLQRFLANQPIEAKRDSTWYVLRKALARHRVAASIAAAFVALISVSAVALAILYQRQFRAREAEVTQRLRAEQEADRANREADRAVQERNKTESFAQFMEETLRGVGPSVALGRDTRMLKELMDAAAKRIEDGELRDIPGAELRLRDSIGNVYREIADFDAAERMLLPALDLAERMHGRNSLEYAAAVRNHAGWLIAKARLAEALPKSEAALAIRRRLLPPDHRDIASSLNDVAVCMQALGRTPEALPKLEAALDMWQRVMPGDHDEVAMTLNNLGDCHQMLGRFAEALPRFEGALAMWQRLHPGDHPNVAFGLNNVGHCLRFMGRSAEALPKNAAALDMYQRLFPGDHPNVSVSLLNVANCLTSLGRPAEALTKSVAALEMLQRLFPGDHRDVATAMNHVAMSLASLDRPTEALPKYEAALEMWQRIFHGDHPQVAAGMNNLARCLVELNRHTEALPKYEASLEMWQRLHPDGHPESVTVLNNLGICLKSLDRPAEALAKHEAALAICKRVLPASHQSVAFSEVAAGAALVDLDRLEGAETLLLKGYTALSDKPGAAARYRKLALEALVKFYNARHAAQPGNGFDAKADEYRRMLAAIAP